MTVTDTDTDVTPDAAEDDEAADVGTTEDTTTDQTAEDADTSGTEAEDDSDDGDQDDEDGDTFPRAYVEKLRAQNARYRERAKTAEGYAKRLHTEIVRSTGRLADPTDLEFDEDHLDDPDALAAALDDLLTRKPHLASRKPVGDIGQGARGSGNEQVGLLSILKGLT